MADTPAGYWRLGEASGTSAADETTNGSTGIYQGGVTLGVGGAVAGDPSTAARFDGSNDLVTMGDPASGILDVGTSDFTIEAWVRTSVNGERLVAGKRDTGPYWRVTVTDDSGHAGQVRATIYDGSVTREGYSVGRVDDGAWHHVVVVFDRDVGISFYVDGAASGSKAGAMASDISNAGSFQVAKISGYSYFSGDIDEVALYRTALSPSRIQIHQMAAVVDTTPPAVTLTSPGNGSSTPDTTPTFAGSAGSASSDSMAVTVNVYEGVGVAGAVVQTLNATRSGGMWSIDASSALALGTYTARAEQSDAAGNTGISSENTFSITLTDETPPAVTLATPANGSATSDTTPTFAGNAGTEPDDSATVTVRVYSGPAVGATPVQTLSATRSGGSYSMDASPALAPGTYTARAEQSDATGNVGFSTANTFTLTLADPVLVGAGDIADCGTTAQDEETAQLLDGLPEATVFTLGDNAYSSGSATEFANCYHPTWGRHKARTRPSAGNHDYGTSGAAGYYGYFGTAAGDPDKGYYSYDLGAWHVVVLNSNCFPIGGCDPGSPQEQWLRNDLATHSTGCTLAYWHHPLFTSRTDSQDPASATFWQVLYEYGAELILTGHAHVYERFAPQTPTGALDLDHGIRQITAGTGGFALYTFETVAPNSEVRINDAHGVLKLTLHATSYDWMFLPVAGKTSTDSGSTPCHGPPTAPPPPPPPPPAACADGLDNDGDGLIDYPADPGCADSADTDETNVPPPPPSGEAPFIRGASAATANGPATQLAIARPSVATEGDLLVAIVAHQGGSTKVMSPPAGWTAVPSTDHYQAKNARIRAWFRIAGPAEPASYMFTLTGSGDDMSGGVLAIGNSNPSAPINASGGQTNAALSRSVTAPSISSTVADTLLLFGGACNNASSFQPAAGMTEVWDLASAGAYKVAIEAASEHVTAAGATGTRTATASSKCRSVAVQIAIAPAP